MAGPRCYRLADRVMFQVKVRICVRVVKKLEHLPVWAFKTVLSIASSNQTERIPYVCIGQVQHIEKSTLLAIWKNYQYEVP